MIKTYAFFVRVVVEAILILFVVVHGLSISVARFVQRVSLIREICPWGFFVRDELLGTLILKMKISTWVF